MNIGVITVHDSSNAGSFLQAYGMKCFLESLGHTVSFVRTRDTNYVKSLFYDNSLLVRSIIKYPIIGVSRYLFNRKKYQIFRAESDRTFKVVSKEKLDSFDLLVLGSDEIWNVKTSVFQNELFYGYGKNNVIAYAVCVGRARFPDYDEKTKDYIRNVKEIMVRDVTTQSVVEQITGQKVPIVCDPTMLMAPGIYETELPHKLMGKDYLLIYAYHIDSKLRKHIKRYAKANKLKIVSAGFWCVWADYNINCESMELYTLSNNAKCVVTTTFHGSIFAILSNSRFISIPGGSIAKVEDLLSRFNLQSQLLNGEEDYIKFSKTLDTEIDYHTVRGDIERFRTKSAENFVRQIDKLEQEYV